MGLFDFIFRARRTSHDEKPFDFSVVPDERLVAAAAKDISDASEEELAMQTEYFRRLAKRRQDGERASGSLVHQYRRTVSFDELISLLSAESQAVLSQTIVPSRIGRTTRIAGPLEIFAGEPLQEIQVLRSGDVGFEEICERFCDHVLTPHPQRIEFMNVWRNDLNKNIKAATFVWLALDEVESNRFASQFSFVLSESVESTIR